MKTEQAKADLQSAKARLLDAEKSYQRLLQRVSQKLAAVTLAGVLIASKRFKKPLD